MSVVVVITRSEEIDETMCWGARFAAARQQALVVLYPALYQQSKAPTRISLEEKHSLPLLDDIRAAAQKIEPAPALFHVQDPDRLRAVLACLKEHKATLLVTGHSSSRKDAPDPGPSLRQALLAHAPCDMVMLRARQESHETQSSNIIVPASGGPHAAAALRLAAQVSDQSDAEVKAVYVEQIAGDDAQAVGQSVLKTVLQRAGVPSHHKLQTQVVLAEDVTEGILQAAQTQKDLGLILLGASDHGFIRRALFGAISDTLLDGNNQMTVGVMRAAQPLVARTRAFVGDLFERWIPQLSREGRITLFERLQGGSQASIDFIALICLSTAIASLGLLQNSGAVIIGAMLVAPLMTPMLGMGLGLVQGNIVLVRKAVISIAVGFLLSFGIGFLIGLSVPSFKVLTPEMVARGQPNLLDLFVALFSGVAAAYALGRPGLLAALPGVAIAAALVPPIATSGASLALGQADNATGAAFLFGVNLIAIIFASSCTLFVLGIRAHQSQKRLWARRSLIGLALLAMLIAIPLGIKLISTLPNPFSPLTTAIQKHIQQIPGLSLAQIKNVKQPDGDILELHLYTPRRLTPAENRTFAQLVRKHTKNRIRIVSILVAEYAANKPKPRPKPTRQTKAKPRPQTKPKLRTNTQTKPKPRLQTKPKLAPKKEPQIQPTRQAQPTPTPQPTPQPTRQPTPQPTSQPTRQPAQGGASIRR